MQCKTSEVEGIMSTVRKKNLGKIKLYTMSGKNLKKSRGETPNMEKVSIYKEAMTDFQNANEFLVTLPPVDDDRDSVATVADPHTPRSAITEIQLLGRRAQRTDKENQDLIIHTSSSDQDNS